MKKSLLISLLAGLSLTANSQQLAFPGAQGWGAYAVGGRYGSVYHVTNLNDSGAGSLRDAVTSKNRIVVFDVSGVIHLKSRLVFASNLYVAGQTAPGEGITVYGNGVSFSGASNTICRYMRFRMGITGDSGKDCASLASGTNMIFDHCSFAWGRDETFSINPDGKGDLHSITIQNCIVGQGLMSHSAGGLIQADNITLYRNLYCDNSTRNNKVKGKNQYVNNIVYNWKDGAYIMGGDSEGQSYCNIVGNLFINGPVGTGDAFTVGNTNFHCYVKDNIQDKNRDGVYNPSPVTSFSGSDVVATPYNYPTLETVSANSLLQSVLPTVGASLPYRDYTDCYMIDEVLSFGLDGALISNENSLLYGNPDTWSLWKGELKKDSDKDGMPDDWETENGTNPSVNDAMTLAANGYTNIENYINGIVAPYNSFLRAPKFVTLESSSQNTLSISWRDWTEGEEFFDIEISKDNVEFNNCGNVEKDKSNFIITDLEPGTQYYVRVRALGSESNSDYSDVIAVKTQPVEEGDEIFGNTFAHIKWSPEVMNWDYESTGWNPESTYSDEKIVDIVSSKDSKLVLDTTVKPKAVFFINDSLFELAGSGEISGEASLIKQGNGVLKLATVNSYTKSTRVYDGTISFPILKDGGLPSSIGASDEFATNWRFLGGTFEYTGLSTSTNRSAIISPKGTFAITNQASTVTMNGNFEGDGDFTLTGKGTLTPKKASFFSYKGKTILKGGTLHLSTPELSNAGIGASSQLVFAGGTLKTAGETEGYETYSFPIEVMEGTESQFSPNRNCYIKSVFTGSGTLQINIPYVREYIQGNFDKFYGRIIAKANANGNLFLLSGKNIPNAVVELKNGARACGWDTSGNYVLGGLSGVAGTYLSGSSKQTNNFTCTWTIGGANTDETFAGSINNWSCSGSGHVGTVNIIKNGTGMWKLTGTNDYKGTTKVNAGTLKVNGTNSGAGTVTVAKDAVLCGAGTIAGPVTIAAGGILQAGDNEKLTNSTLSLKAKLSVLANGILNFHVSTNGDNCRVNKIALSNGATLTNAIIKLDIDDNLSEVNLPLDTELQLFSVTGTVTGTISAIQPAVPGEGKVWDTSLLLKKGILKVVEDPAVSIDNVNVLDSSVKSYNLSGVRVSNSSKGIKVIGKSKVLKK